MVYGSIYGASRIGVSEGSFDPRYAGPDGPDLMVQEALDIDQKMFDVIVEHDFLECAAMQSVEMESALIAVDENFVTDIWDKIKEIIKKIKDKIVSIAKAAAVKLNAFFTRDNAALVSKYRNQYEHAEKSKIEIKNWREFHPEFINESNVKARDHFDEGCKVDTAESKKQFEKNWSADKLLTAVLDRHTTASSFSKDAKDKCFKSARTVKASNIDVVTPLTNYSKAVETINTTKTTFENDLQSMDETANKMKNAADAIDTGDNQDLKDKKEKATISADCARYICSQVSIVYGKVFSAKLEVLKENMKQCRSAFVKIASNGAYKEDADLMAEEADLQDYEVDSFFEQFSYDYEDLIA